MLASIDNSKYNQQVANMWGTGKKERGKKKREEKQKKRKETRKRQQQVNNNDNDIHHHCHDTLDWHDDNHISHEYPIILKVNNQFSDTFNDHDDDDLPKRWHRAVVAEPSVESSICLLNIIDWHPRLNIGEINTPKRPHNPLPKPATLP